jgi:hypothetical protein
MQDNSIVFIYHQWKLVTQRVYYKKQKLFLLREYMDSSPGFVLLIILVFWVVSITNIAMLVMLTWTWLHFIYITVCFISLIVLCQMMTVKTLWTPLINSRQPIMLSVMDGRWLFLTTCISVFWQIFFESAAESSQQHI